MAKHAFEIKSIFISNFRSHEWNRIRLNFRNHISIKGVRNLTSVLHVIHGLS